MDNDELNLIDECGNDEFYLSDESPSTIGNDVIGESVS